MKVSELFTIKKGKKPPKLYDAPLFKGAIPFLKIEAFRDSSAFQFCESSPRLVTCKKDDVLLVWDGANSGLAASGLTGAIGSTIARLRPITDNIDGSYAGHFFRSKFTEIQRNTIGAAIPHVNGTHLREMEVFLPPLDDQKRIAAVLDKADALRRYREESLQFTEELLQSVFIDMFVRNPDATNWTPRSIKWMAKDAKGAIRTGPFGSQLLHSEFVESGIAVLGIDNAVQNRFVWGQRRFITPEKYQKLKRYKVFPGDLIITIMGTLGRCAIIPEDIPDAINTKHLCCITLDPEKCLPEFLHAAFLNHPDVLRQLGVRAKGAVMPGLNMGIIKGLKLPLPPAELQREFKRVIARCVSSRAAIEESQDALEQLFGSIQQRAFRGELDLSRLTLEAEVEPPTDMPTTEPVEIAGRYKRPGSFIAPPDIEAKMMALEDQLDTGPGDSIAWDEDYFKYRILSQVLKPPFSFTDIWEAVEYDMIEPIYETVKDKIFEYVEEGTLEQKFDEERKEIVFSPRP